MKNKKGFLGKLLFFIVYIALVSAIIFLSYYIYQNLPGATEKPEFILSKKEPPEVNIIGSAVQFYPNMKFNHNEIIYLIDATCSPAKVRRVIEAFNQLSTSVPEISFHRKLSSSPKQDIEVSCSPESKYLENEGLNVTFIAGEGGARAIVPTGEYYIITDGLLLLHENPKGFKQCEWPNIELHELLHVFGFNHSEDTADLLYPFVESCDQRISKSVIERLRELYSIKNLPDLYFEEENITLIKRGIYIDFNVTVRNSGLTHAKNATISVFDTGTLVRIHELGDINYGAGVILEIENLKIANRYSKQIDFIIDYDDKIKELDENNNIAQFRIN
jgi:hypothetical protein